MIKNYTPHDVNVLEEKYCIFNDKTKSYCVKDEEYSILHTFTSQGVARCSLREEKISDIEGIPIVKNFYGAVYGLPDEEKGLFYIVSILVAQSLSGLRHDLIVPSRIVRDCTGKIIGCLAFSQV